MTKKDLLLELKVPPTSLHIQDLRAFHHGKLNLITTFGDFVTDANLLRKIRQRVSEAFIRKAPKETIADIYAVPIIMAEIRHLEAQIDQDGS